MNRKPALTLAFAFAAGLAGLALAAGAAGSPSGGTRTLNPHGVVVALATSRSQVAFALGQKVSVWNLSTGRTTTVSGRLTAQDGNVIELAVAGSQVTWYMNAFGNLESDDYLFDSSLLAPRERLVATAVRMGEMCGAAGGGGLWPPSCAGKGIGGVVATGSRTLVGRWTANSERTITDAGMYALTGKTFTPVATGPLTVKPVAADSKRVAVLHADGTLGMYSTSGKALCSLTPAGRADAVALSGRSLVALEPKGTLVLYDAGTCAIRKTFTPHGRPSLQAESRLAVRNGVAVYSAPAHRNKSGAVSRSAVHALNLATGKEKVVATRPGTISALAVGPAGLVYANSGNGFGPSRVVLVPFAKVAAAV